MSGVTYNDDYDGPEHDCCPVCDRGSCPGSGSRGASACPEYGDPEYGWGHESMVAPDVTAERLLRQWLDCLTLTPSDRPAALAQVKAETAAYLSALPNARRGAA